MNDKILQEIHQKQILKLLFAGNCQNPPHWNCPFQQNQARWHKGENHIRTAVWPRNCSETSNEPFLPQNNQKL